MEETKVEEEEDAVGEGKEMTLLKKKEIRDDKDTVRADKDKT